MRFINATRRNGRRALGAVLLAMTAGAVAPAAQADAAYQLRVKSSDKCLHVEGASLADGANVMQWTCGDYQTNQVWELEHAGTRNYVDYYRLKARHSGKCLDVGAGSYADEANVHQWGCHWGSNQQWRFVYRADGYYEIRARHSNKCLDVYYGTLFDGENVQQYTCWGGDMQLWKRVYTP